MANTMSDGRCGGKGFYNAWLCLLLVGQFINLVISKDVCVGFDFAYGDTVVGGF